MHNGSLSAEIPILSEDASLEVIDDSVAALPADKVGTITAGTGRAASKLGGKNGLASADRPNTPSRTQHRVLYGKTEERRRLRYARFATP